MHAYNFDSTHYEIQQRIDARTREASNERLAHELRGVAATGRPRKRARTPWAGWLHRPASVRTSLSGARG